MTELLLETVHGSHLYGTSRPESDLDTYRVVARDPSVLGHNQRGKKISQKITGKDDVYTIDFSAWMRQLEMGVPQAWEAAMSDVASIDLIRDFRKSLRAGTPVVTTYLRTIKSFAFDERDGGAKKRRHSLRLALNARDILRYGRFQPRMKPEDAARALEFAQYNDGEAVYSLATELVFSDKEI